MIRGLHHVQVNVPLARETEARRFYALLGFEEVARPDSLGQAGRAGIWYRCGNGEFHVYLNPAADFHASATDQHPALLVQDLAALRSRLADAGVPLQEAIPIEGRERFFARDPGGNRIEFLAITGA